MVLTVVVVRARPWYPHPCGLATPMTKPRPGRRQRGSQTGSRYFVLDAREEMSTVHSHMIELQYPPLYIFVQIDTHQSAYARWPGKWSASKHASH